MARAMMGRGLHKYPPAVNLPINNYTPINYGTREAKIYGNNDAGTIENPTDDITPQIEGYLPPGWILNTATVSLSNGTTYGPFAISVTSNILSIVVDSDLPYGTYSILGTPVSDTNGNLRAISRTITIQNPVTSLGAFHIVFNNAFKQAWKGPA